MNKLLTTLALVAFTSAATIGGAYAGPGGPGNDKPAGGGGPQINIFGGGGGGGGGGAAGGGYSGGEVDSPGDAFYPDFSIVGDPRQDCLDAGGRSSRQHGSDIEWVCIL